MTNAEICTAGSDEQGCYIWHWHISLYRELERLRDVGEPVYNIPGIAANLKAPSMDVNRWANDLVRAGLVREAEPAWDYEARWITLV